MNDKKQHQATIGFRVKSGWASVVLLIGPAKAPAVIDHRVLHLSDPNIPESKQPYHASAGTLEEDRTRITKRVRIVQRITRRSVGQLLKGYERNGCSIKGAGLAVGSLIEPCRIGNQHMRAHALEGQLFRNALKQALRSHHIPSLFVLEREAYANASVILAQKEDRLKKAIADFGRSAGKPWRAHEKLAAMAAWIVLTQGRRRMTSE